MRTFTVIVSLIIFINPLNAQFGFDHYQESLEYYSDDIDIDILEEINSKPNPNYEKDLDVLVPILDSTYYFVPNIITDWRLSRKTINLNFDEYGNILNDLTEQWDEDQMIWQNWKNKEASYFTNGQEDEVLEKDWNSSIQAWTDTSRYDSYNEEGMRLYSIIKFWSESDNEYFFGFRFRPISFSPEGNLLIQRTDLWNTSNENWDLSSEFSYTFEGNLRTKTSIKTWDTDTETWVDSQVIIYAYDEDDNRILRARYKYNDGILDENPYRQFSYTYVDGLRVSTLQERWNVDSNALINYVLSTSTFNEAGNISYSLEQRWLNNAWENRSEHYYSYDEDQNRIEFRERNWIVENNEWTDNWKYEYYYSLHNVVAVEEINANQILIFPNPSSDKIHLQLEAFSFDNLKVDVYDISGALVIKNQSLFNAELDVSSLHSGIYFLSISTGKKVFVKRFVKG